MAKYERAFTGDFDTVLEKLHDGVLNGSASASYEDGSDYDWDHAYDVTNSTQIPHLCPASWSSYHPHHFISTQFTQTDAIQ